MLQSHAASPARSSLLPSLAWRRTLSPALLSALVLLVAAVVVRRGQFGNPIAGLDEQLYLLVGDRMWHGELPYRDIWDRKPFGLFVLFAAIRAIPGEPFLVAQLVATGFAAGTAWAIAYLAQRWTGWAAATLAALFYLAEMMVLWGDTTQSPVFYNLFLAGAAILAWRAGEAPLAPGAAWRMAAAMAVAGLAVQIKTNAVFEGGFFALWYLAQRWQVERSAPRLAAATLALALIGAAPTLAAIGFYAAIGEFPAWWQANVLSVIAKGRPSDAGVAAMLVETLALLLPVVLMGVLGLRSVTRAFTRWNAASLFLAGWTAVSLVDFVAIGGYYPHYALPLLLPVSVLAAFAAGAGTAGRIAWFATMLVPLAATQYAVPVNGAADRAIAERVRAAIPADVRTKCLFVFEGPVAYYQLTDACRVTRYAFSAHISSLREAAALGTPPAVALDAAMARRPGTVITVEHPPQPDRNPAMEARILRALHRDYRPIARLPHRFFTEDETLVVWRRGDLS